MKKFTYKLCGFAAVIVSTAVLGGCGGTEKDAADAASDSAAAATAAVVEDTAKEAKPIDEIYAEIAQKVELVSPVEMDDEFISNYYGIEPDTLEEYVFSMSEEATSAETVVIMKVKDDAAVSDLETALNTVIDEKRAEMENYLPEQFEIVDKSSVSSKGNYVWLVISQNQDAIIEIIEADI